MSESDLKQVWADKYSQVPQILNNIQEVKTAATAFNTNIDAVLKIKGDKIAELALASGLNLKMLSEAGHNRLLFGSDVIKGIFKCFTRGIAEEWLTEDKIVFDWMVKHLGYDRLQMGGQGGIVANVLAVAGVKKVVAHTNSLPKLQAEQFLKLDNLVSFDENGNEKTAYLIDRKEDIPLIHWIIEFDKGDSFTFEGETFVCPKSNRFIATYDPMNLHLVMDKSFVETTVNQKMDYVILSGFHALTKQNDGVNLIKKSLPIIETWKENKDIIHLEIASTQDVAVRKAIVEEVAPKVDSVGINEREAIDILEVIGYEDLAKKCNENTHSKNLFEALLAIKNKLKTPRIQLHMFGLYMTLQDKGFKITPEANLRGMMLAATIAASKAGTGNIHNKENLLWALGQKVSDVGLQELVDLAELVKAPALLETGMAEVNGYDLIALPTILVEKPLTLVGMGDTISSLSLIGAR